MILMEAMVIKNLKYQINQNGLRSNGQNLKRWQKNSLKERLAQVGKN